MNIKLKRISINLTQKELAKKAGISNVTLSKFEKGNYENITLKTMKKIAKALGTTVEELFLTEE